MRIAVIGGGPGGLYFAALTKQLDPDHEITVWERNAPDDTFGFGVVFSDETLGGIEHADPAIYARDGSASSPAGTTSTCTSAATRITVGGHGFAAMSRKRLLRDPAGALRRARRRRRTSAPRRPDVDELARDYDLVVAADGRQLRRSAPSTPTSSARRLDARRCKYMWLGTDQVFDAFKFYIRETPYGVMQVHGYPYDATGSTFIVEMHEDVWRARRLRRRRDAAVPPGRERRGVDRADRASSSPTCSTGTQVLANNSKWISFTHGPQRDAGGTATSCCSATPRTPRTSPSAPAPSSPWRTRSRWPPACTSSPTSTTALDGLRGRAAAGRRCPPSAPRRPAWSGSRTSASTSTRTRRSSRSTSLTRSRRVTYDNLRLRDPEFVAADGRVVRRGTQAAPATARAADVPAVPAAASWSWRTGSSSRRWTCTRAVDGVPERLPPRPPRRQGARRRRAGDDRDGLRLARGPDHARAAPGSGHDEQRDGLAPDRRLRARAARRRRSASSSATPAARARPG